MSRFVDVVVDQVEDPVFVSAAGTVESETTSLMVLK
jgi:hypothetical protein